MPHAAIYMSTSAVQLIISTFQTQVARFDMYVLMSGVNQC